LVPKGLEIDTVEGRGYVGIVAFTMSRLRPIGLPAVPILSDCHETNVRTYVRFRGGDPGVWFFSLDASNGTAVRIARTFWRLNYIRARIDLARNNGHIGYRLDRAERTSARLRVSYSPLASPRPSPPGTLQHWLVERYRLYASEGGALYSGCVSHLPYPTQPATVHEFEETMLRSNGIPRPEAPPLAHYSPGVDVRIHPPRRCRIRR